ncbi:hypothetical protein MB46_20020 (plasmid) [Arthrobacter alpinus]|uniref:hypothetical protein n=1 Tax=Arthrobacter alpinus TaxID=656366 RepID=UPI0005C8F1E6|nr:hypothetical protein [Arthrobacter alpinus]ALV47813.1 hypothetical protein MB46_19220 [Arthrobacter alpinus]ALV47953.1 hypothetical protein MB46_20020 [Arthrobacter alpinus]
MTNQTLRRVHGVTVAVLILGLSLTACSGKTLKVDGQEVQDFDTTITALDDAWKQSLTDGKKANLAKDDASRCYAQVNDEILAEEAICGPVHYLGFDDTTWDTVALKPVLGDSSGKVKIENDSSFFTGNKKGNTELYRPDGKQPPSDTNVPEPDAKTAESEQAIWIQASGPQAPSSTASDEAKPTVIQTPDARISVLNARITDRIGGTEDRQQAGEGHKFASVTLSLGNSSDNSAGSSTPTPENKTVLAFTSGGKSYNVGKPQNGTLAMAVAGDGKDLAMTVTYEGKTQVLSLSDSSLDAKTKTLAYYDGYDSVSADSGKVGDLKIESQDGFDLTFYGTSYSAERLPYDPAVGWAPEGKTWLKISGSPTTDGPQWKPDKGYDYGYYKVTEDIISGTVTNVSGNAFKADLKSHPVQESTGGWLGTAARVSAIFEVPTTAKDFKASFVLRATGILKKDQSNAAAPGTASFDSPVKDLQFTFPQSSSTK